VSKVRELVEEEGNENLKLRVVSYPSGGLLWIFSTGFSFDKVPRWMKNAVIPKDGMSLLVDP